jgi:two-component system response regulator YesN
MSVFSNMIAPLIAGTFFFLYFVFFSIANPSKAASYRYFVVFLVGISVFSFGRPLQLVLGPHPMPLVVVNARMLLLCGVIAPVIILASDLFANARRKRLQSLIIVACALLGVVYTVFNTLGTKESRVLFRFAGIAAHDNFTPSMQAPFFGREVTIAVQVVTGLLLASFSFLKLTRLRPSRSFGTLVKSKVFLFNGGVFIFAVSFIVGSLAKQWGIYYAASILSALLFGWSVVIDVKETYHSYEKLIPFIKEDVIQNVAFSEFSKEKLTEMLSCLGKSGGLNTFVVVKLAGNHSELYRDLKMKDEAIRIASESLREVLDESCFLPLPLAGERVGIALRLSEDCETSGKRIPVLEILEEIRERIGGTLRCGVSVGIGRTYDRIEDLRVSYREALNAQEYAERLENSGTVHVDNIIEPGLHTNVYPVKEKERLLSLIKVGDLEGGRAAFAEFMERFKAYIAERPDVLNVRLYEFIGSLIDSAILGGGDEKRLNELIGAYFNDINHITDLATVEHWMTRVVTEVANSVVRVFESRSKSIVRNAIRYMEQRSDTQLSYRDVAKEVFISPSYFLCLFKRETGLTFTDYLAMIRIERAKELLLNSGLSITQIAFDTGFNNSNYFSSQFRKLVGTTAKAFREKNRAMPAWNESR